MPPPCNSDTACPGPDCNNIAYVVVNRFPCGQTSGPAGPLLRGRECIKILVPGLIITVAWVLLDLGKSSCSISTKEIPRKEGGYN